jgi:carboxyl-terminal processing protease
MKLTYIFLFVLLTTALIASDSTRIEFTRLNPEPQHKKVAALIVKYLDNFHYQKKELGDSMSVEILERFFDKLDPTRVYFLESDIIRFEKYRYVIDDYLKIGYVDPAYEIFNVFEERMAERLAHVYKILDKPFDFTLDEYLEIERSDAPWVKSIPELDELWRKRKGMAGNYRDYYKAV